MANDEAVLSAISASIERDGSTYVVLQWEAVADVDGYNLYRRLADSPPRESRPVNGSTPIRPPRTRRQLRAVFPEGSVEWEALRHGFAAVAEPDTTKVELPDPAERFERGLTEREAALVAATARANLPMGHAAGLAYTDRGVRADQRYLYELRAVLADGSERVLAVDVPIWAGHFILPDPPSGLGAQVGDRRALVLWNRNPHAATFAVQRATTPGGPFQQVNLSPVAYDVSDGLDGLPVGPQPGFLDVCVFDPDGSPTSHVVEGLPVFGPENGTTYFYRVASCDNLGRTGAWSGPVAATPMRTLAPMAPDDLAVSPTSAADGLVVSWRTVTRNVENHLLGDAAQTNFVYRAETRDELEDLNTLASYQVAAVVVNPNVPPTPATLTWTDNDAVLIAPYGSKPFFYRVRVQDPYAHWSLPSAVISGAVPDTRAPGPTTLVAVDGEPNHITVSWSPNSEPDLAGYQIYRGVCDHGYLYLPGVTWTTDKEGKLERKGESRFRCDMTLVGDVARADADAMFAADGFAHFDDLSVPEGSPLCYAYWVRAYDQAGNLYDGDGGCPRPGEYRCGRLLERTPPPVPVMTGLRARNHGVLVEWVASPIQDLRAFHVYRSDKEMDPPRFLACVFTDGTLSATPWKGLKPSCADVPAVADPLAARGSYLDGTAEPHHVYWYRVSALDWLGNESEGATIEDVPSSSTFAYTSDLPVMPTVLAPVPPVAGGCGLDVAWGPVFDPTTLQGFVVFRSPAGGLYRQVSEILTINSFTDGTARRGVDYLYCVQSVDASGILSRPSIPVLHRY